MKTTTYKTTRLTSVTRTTTPVRPVAVFEIITPDTAAPAVLIDGLVPLALAKLFESLTAAHNRGELRFD